MALTSWMQKHDQGVSYKIRNSLNMLILDWLLPSQNISLETLPYLVKLSLKCLLDRAFYWFNQSRALLPVHQCQKLQYLALLVQPSLRTDVDPR